MKVENLKLNHNNIAVRMAPGQFIAKFGYDMEWVPQHGLFYVHDTERKQLHVIPMTHVTNFIPVCEPEEFMAALRDAIAAGVSMDPKLIADVAAQAAAETKPKKK